MKRCRRVSFRFVQRSLSHGGNKKKEEEKKTFVCSGDKLMEWFSTTLCFSPVKEDCCCDDGKMGKRTNQKGNFGRLVFFPPENNASW